MGFPFVACFVETDGADGGGDGIQFRRTIGGEEGREEPLFEDEEGAEVGAVVETVAEDVEVGWSSGRSHDDDERRKESGS